MNATHPGDRPALEVLDQTDRVAVPCVIDGPINCDSFLARMEQMLVSALKLSRQAFGALLIQGMLGLRRQDAARTVSVC